MTAQMTLHDHAFVAALSAIAVNPMQDGDRTRFLLGVATEHRGKLTGLPEITRLSRNHDALTALSFRSEGWASEFFDLRRNLAAFHEWRLGRARDALSAAP